MSIALAPLNIACTATHCGTDVAQADRRHSFTTTVDVLPGTGGACRACGTDLIDWGRCHQRDPSDLDALVRAMRQELIRDAYWGHPLPPRIVSLAKRRRPDDLRAAQHKLLARVLPPPEAENPWLRSQTYYADTQGARIVHCAQHATATCCRRCLEIWHGIPRDQRLTDRDLTYFARIVWLYTERRLDEAEAGGALAA